ncbi:3-oxoacyl-ACP reductase [Lactobacillus sp. Sy-1]|uniref:3-oxoacyl-ACP reductase n=1 Tax=Lactobacillus sp. Sy-1 TaxID=2109645 RepID=UPI001C5ACA64|nr:3-oxoacyl-ACP reductase [Lactobacillus sp. Sy-1]MBW1606353.1 3-oxoacyl-ACP reductase [Lactobacillus sp. Sy-1]
MAKTVLITGASSGLGAETARQFGTAGFNVVVNYYHHQAAADKVVAQIGSDHAIAIQADVRNRDAVDQMVNSTIDKFGSLDVVVNNALVGFKFDPVKQKAFKDLSWDDYQKQIDGTLKGAFNVIQSALPEMVKNHYGKVVSIGTNLFQNPVVPYHEYTTAKAALIGFTRNLAAELGEDGISFNMVSGGLLRTTNASSVTTPEVFDLIATQTPLKEVTTPEQVAKMVLFLGSPESDGITGQNYTVDGGLTMN